MTIRIYRGFDRSQALGVYSTQAQALKAAKRLSRTLGKITGRDVLGGLRFEITPSAPAAHKIKITK